MMNCARDFFLALWISFNNLDGANDCSEDAKNFVSLKWVVIANDEVIRNKNASFTFSDFTLDMLKELLKQKS